jgi:hypothetical protein
MERSDFRSFEAHGQTQQVAVRKREGSGFAKHHAAAQGPICGIGRESAEQGYARNEDRIRACNAA